MTNFSDLTNNNNNLNVPNTTLLNTIHVERGIIPDNLCDFIVQDTEKREWKPRLVNNVTYTRLFPYVVTLTCMEYASTSEYEVTNEDVQEKVEIDAQIFKVESQAQKADARVKEAEQRVEQVQRMADEAHDRAVASATSQYSPEDLQPLKSLVDGIVDSVTDNEAAAAQTQTDHG